MLQCSLRRGTHVAPWTGLGVRDIVEVGIDLASSIGARLGCKRWPCGNLSYMQNKNILHIQYCVAFYDLIDPAE